MQRAAAILALAAAAALLSGCYYNPYTGTYAPCCGYYGYPYGYRYPGPYPAYPPPYGQQPAGQYQGQPGQYQGQPEPYQGQPGLYQGQPGAYPSQPGAYQGQPPGPQARGGALAQRFAAANVTRDGRLTRQQAEAGMPLVAQNFDAIDVDQNGYVTLPEIRTFISRQRAAGGQVGEFETD
jgi:hypothetical protein